MVFANAGSLGAAPGRRDELVHHLTRRSDHLRDVGCLLYEVGVNDAEPDTVYVVELWESADAHRASLALPEVQASIAAARPLLSGEFGGFRFEVVGSPLRDGPAPGPAPKHVPAPDEPSIPELETDETIAPRPEEEIADILRAEPDVEDHSRRPG
ncbi:hypothetical protein GCM10025760_00940 [Microbacterium yannicii]|uniref:ABM domain-containing protein n=1 Tax=Microbacterium yannicii TaxID=671622 RepID=A0ABP9LVT7_9MICO|nr:antibiotic biosynthesis monooxygenase [Microbacterium yannicii]